MTDLNSIDIEDPEARNRYLSELSEIADSHGYPICDPDFFYYMTDAMFLKEEAEETGYNEFAEDVDTVFEDIFEPVEELQEENQKESLSEEAFSIADTSPVFQQAIGGFIQSNEKLIKGGDMANRYIISENRLEALGALVEFRTWYEDQIDSSLEDIHGEPVIEGVNRSYTRQEYRKTSLFNGLRILLYRREHDEVFETEEMTPP